MTRSTRIYGKVALLMAGILAASVLLTLAVGVKGTTVYFPFHPAYVIHMVKMPPQQDIPEQDFLPFHTDKPEAIT